jgi:hypothetical protein
MLKERATCIEELEKLGIKKQSLGIVKPTELLDFAQTSNPHYEALITKSAQTDLFGQKAIKIDIPRYKYRYIFKDDPDGRIHELLCEDWELGELYRKCEDYRKMGKYADHNEVHQKVRDKMLSQITKYGHVYFVVGSHYRFPTYVIVGVVYPRKADIDTI